jgi:hypothetical protein
MKTKMIAIAGVALLTMALTQTVQALPLPPITGTINFQGGTVTLNGTGINDATAITAFGGSPVVNNNAGVQPTGSYAGTGGDAVTFAPGGFTFSPSLIPNPVNPLWTFSAGGLVYSFSLMTVQSAVSLGSLNLSGTGMAYIVGANAFTGNSPTAGSWTLSTTGTGPSIFGFVAGNNPVPDGGATLVLLGIALTGVSLLKKKLTA